MHLLPRILGAAALFALPVTAFAQAEAPPRKMVIVERDYYPEVEAYAGGEPVRYRCDNGASFAVEFDKVHGTSTAQVRYADSFENEARRSLLLVAGPTGSGVRYSNDAAVLHLKGKEARIDIPETAGTDAFSAENCVLEPEVGEPTLMQDAIAGSYFFAIDRFYPGQYEAAHFAKAEVVCFIAADADFYAVVPAPGDYPARYYVSHGKDMVETGPMLIGALDAGVSQRRYPIDMGYPGSLTMHFAAHGAIDGNVRAMAGISSISSDKGDRLECLDDGDFLYVGLFDDRTVAVELTEQGTLVYRGWTSGEDAEETVIEGGQISWADGRTTFHFFDKDGALVQIVAASDGKTPPDAFFVHGPEQWLEQQALAYFIADVDTWNEKIAEAPADHALLLASLEICNHLAGEGGDEARNRQIGLAQDRYRCVEIAPIYDRALAEQPEGSSMRAFLDANAPVWR